MVKKFVSKRLGILRKLKLKKSVSKGIDPVGSNMKTIMLKGKKGKIKARIDTYTDKGDQYEHIMDIRVKEKLQGMGVGTKLMQLINKGSKRKVSKGVVMSEAQMAVRRKFQGTWFEHKPGGKSYPAFTPTKQKKILNKTTGKIKFVRIRGVVRPIRVKK